MPFDARARERSRRWRNRQVAPRREALKVRVAVETDLFDLDIRPAPIVGLGRQIRRRYVPDVAFLVIHLGRATLIVGRSNPGMVAMIAEHLVDQRVDLAAI